MFLGGCAYLRAIGLFSPVVSGQLTDAFLIGAVAAVLAVMPLLRVRELLTGTSAVLSNDGVRVHTLVGDRFIRWAEVVAVEPDASRRLVRLLLREPGAMDRLFRSDWCVAVPLQFTGLSVQAALRRLVTARPGLAARIRER